VEGRGRGASSARDTGARYRHAMQDALGKIVLRASIGREMATTTAPTTPRERPDRATPRRVLARRYQLLRSLASGGMGEVFAAYDVVLDREVAVKLPRAELTERPGFVERFRREARAAAALAHPNVVAVFDAGDDDGTPFIVMELVRGRSLRAALRHADAAAAEGPTVVELLSQILAALEHAHGHSILHLDLKPENVMIAPDGVAKVADFGLARAAAEADPAADAVYGTLGYVAPEALHGRVDERSDLYSVGVMARELLGMHLAGTTPGASTTTATRPHERRPSPLEAWAAALSSEDPRGRPPSAAAAREWLRRIADAPDASHVPTATLVDGERGSSTTDPAMAVTLRRQRATVPSTRRFRRAVAGLAAVTIAVVAVVGFGIVEARDATVPSVVGLRVARARHVVASAGLRVRLRSVYSTAASAGTVSRIAPHAGATLERGDRATLFVSLGPPPVPVPSVVGKTLNDADATLRSAGLRLGVVEHAYDASHAAGTIAAQRIMPGERAPEGSRVGVTLSEGPQPFAIPNVVGSPSGDASSLLEGLGLTVRTIDVSFLGFTGNTVVRQSPAAGRSVRPGDVVRLYLD
jgi:eukaryotic-like serine/threonine-protein kinase